MADGSGKSVDGDFLAGGGGAVDAVDDLLDGETGFTGGGLNMISCCWCGAADDGNRLPDGGQYQIRLYR